MLKGEVKERIAFLKLTCEKHALANKFDRHYQLVIFLSIYFSCILSDIFI